MKTAVNDICGFLKQEVDVPVFDYTLPDGFSSACIVVSETTFDEEREEGTYHVNLYAPDKTRIQDGVTDNAYPDMETLTEVANQVLPLLCDIRTDEFNGWVTKRNLLKEGNNMHYINICLTIQFN